MRNNNDRNSATRKLHADSDANSDASSLQYGTQCTNKTLNHLTYEKKMTLGAICRVNIKTIVRQTGMTTKGIMPTTNYTIIGRVITTAVGEATATTT